MTQSVFMTGYMIQMVSILAVSFGIALVCTPLVIKLAKKIGAMDVPKDDRRMHKKPIPRMGGLAIFVGALAAILIFIPLNSAMIGLLAGGSLMFLVGFVDDIKNLSAKIKLVFQIAGACILYGFGVRITFMGLPFIGYQDFSLPVVSFLLTLIWVVGITNTINLIDGLDGLAAGIAAIASASIAYTAFVNDQPLVGTATMALAGAALGFLPYNFNPAKIFMGDGGALFLGFMLAGLSIMGLTKGATLLVSFIPLFVLGIPIFDTVFAILRRIINKRPIMEADKGHLHHKIMEKGLGQRRTVILLYSMGGLLGIAGVLLAKELRFEAAVLIVITGALIYVFMKEYVADDANDDVKIYKR